LKKGNEGPSCDDTNQIESSESSRTGSEERGENSSSFYLGVKAGFTASKPSNQKDSVEADELRKKGSRSSKKKKSMEEEGGLLITDPSLKLVSVSRGTAKNNGRLA